MDSSQMGSSQYICLKWIRPKLLEFLGLVWVRVELSGLIAKDFEIPFVHSI